MKIVFLIGVIVLVGRDFGDLPEATLTKGEEVDVTTATEAALLNLKHSASDKVGLLLLDREVHVSIDHVLQLV